jgi:beta-N-acetylhexosaminidase
VDTATVRQLCGQILTLGFEGPTAPRTLLQAISRGEVGGVILFRSNIVDPPQVASLVARLREAAPPGAPLAVAVDQEGGAVQRVRAPLTEWPDMLSVGAAGDLVRTEAVGRALGRELAALGIGWDLAPVLDVHTNSANPVIGRRAFGTTPDAVCGHALAFWRGLRSSGVLGCGKHYPGHGDTQMDSHLDLPVVTHDEQRLRAVELAPFAAAVRAGAESLMTAHVLYPALDPQRPATLSPRIATDLLRRELGFEGLLVSDDLAMRAVADRWPIEALVLEALLAGVDHFLIRGPEALQVAAWEALVRAAESRSDVRARLRQAGARNTAFKQKLGVGRPLAPDALETRVGTSEHRALAVSFGRADPGRESSSAVADS